MISIISYEGLWLKIQVSFSSLLDFGGYDRKADSSSCLLSDIIDFSTFIDVDNF